MAKMEQAEFGDKLREVFDLLKEASSEKRDEILDKIKEFYDGVKEAEGRVFDKAKKAAYKVDEKVHSNPWPFIGAAAVSGMLVGLLVRFSRRASQQA